VSQSFITGLEENIITLESEKIAAYAQVEDLNILTGSLYEEIQQLYDYITELLAGGSGNVVLTTTILPNGTVGSQYQKTLSATGGLTPYDWTVVQGSLPAGLTLNSTTGIISGTPTAVYEDVIAIKVSDSSPVPQTDTQTFTLKINPAPLPRNVNATLRAQNAGGITANVRSQIKDIGNNVLQTIGTQIKEGLLIGGSTEIRIAYNITYPFNECVIEMEITHNGVSTLITESDTKVFWITTEPTDDLEVRVKYSQSIIP
jgi:hypothetical protein